jgi:hypothetical protein
MDFRGRELVPDRARNSATPYCGIHFRPPPPQYTQYVAQNESKNNQGLKWLCGSQIIRRSDYTNFSTLAIGLVFGLGSLVIVVSLSLETVVGYVRLKWRKGRWRQRAWWAEGTLQLQRRAFEGMGIKDWEFGEWDRVPVTGKGRVWSALGNWDDMLPQAKEVKTVSQVRQRSSDLSRSDEGKDLQSTTQLSSTGNNGNQNGGAGHPTSPYSV